VATERHFLFPTIKMYLSPIQDQDSMVIPFKFDQVSIRDLSLAST
jgi:hypothetical protein